MRNVVATVLSATLLVLACTGDTGGPTSAGYNIAPDGGDGQTGLVGEALPISPAVRITDRNGDPVAHVGITFSVSTGGGSVSGANATTDADGRAAVGHWTLGTRREAIRSELPRPSRQGVPSASWQPEPPVRPPRSSVGRATVSPSRLEPLYRFAPRFEQPMPTAIRSAAMRSRLR